MIIKKRFVKALIAIFTATLLMMSLAGCGAKKNLETGSTWEVAETTKLASLTIEKDATIKGPDNQSITMTVNQIETAIEPGTYKGDIVLTVTNEIQPPITMGGGPPGGDSGGGSRGNGGAPEGASGGAPGGGDMTAGGGVPSGGFRTAIYVDGGVYMPEKSVPAAVVEGEVTDNSATDISISSTSKDFYGIIVTGDSTYSISNLKINFNGGDQGNYGYGITSGGNADVTVNNASIISKGVQRAAIVVGGNSTMHVNDSYIEAYDGILPEHLANMEESNSLEVPWVLGFIGNNRATNVVNSGTAYYSNTHVKAQRWGCLSTDAAQSVKLYATKCHLEAVESGYGAYSIGDTITAFDECIFDVHDYGLIMTGQGSATFTNGTVVNSGRFGVLSHGGNLGNLNIDKGCVFNTEKAVIQLKSSYPSIIVDNAELNSKNGVILEAIVNDDPWMTPSAAKMPEGGIPGGAGGAPDGGAGAPGSGMPEGGMPSGAAGGRDTGRPVNATFKNMKMDGDIINAMTTLADINITLENATITGAITTATSTAQAEIDGVKISKQTYYYIGAVKNTYCATDGKYGIKVSLDGGSKWIVNENSYLTNLTISEGAVIAAPDNFKLTMTVNGVRKGIKAGEYSGKIALTITKS